jgi:hypothetical protein
MDIGLLARMRQEGIGGDARTCDTCGFLTMEKNGLYY